MRISAWWLPACFGLVVRVATGCGTTSPPAPSYPPYTSHEAELFDDRIDPRVLGVGYDAPNVAPRGDASLFERAQTGDLVVRGRIDSVTMKGAGPNTFLELGIRVVEPLMSKVGEPGASFVLRVDRSSPSYGTARALEGRLSGRALIAFVRTYGTETGETALHFHLVPDEPSVASAVREALSLDRVAPTDAGANTKP